MCKKLTKCIFAFRTIRKYCNLEAAKVAYFGYFQSVLSYSIIFWGGTADCFIRRIFILQKMVIRAMCLLHPQTSCKDVFVEHGILTVPSLYILEILTFVKNNPEHFV